MRDKTRSTRDWQVNSVGWSVCRLYNFDIATNSQIWQVIGGHIQSIGCVLDRYRGQLAILNQKLISDTAFRTANSCLLFMSSPTATAQIYEIMFSSLVVHATTGPSRQSIEAKTVGTLTITGTGNLRNLNIPRTTTSYQVSKRRFVFMRKSWESGGYPYPTTRHLFTSLSETTDVLMVRV